VPKTQELANFDLTSPYWENVVALGTVPKTTPSLFLERIAVRADNPITLDCRQSTMIIYVESVAEGAYLKFMRALGTAEFPDALGTVYLYSKEYGDEEPVVNKVYDLEPGDNILVSDATYTVYCDDEVGASVLLAGVDSGFQCGGRPCHGYTKKT
jgi:hypothetical protein